MDKVLKKVVGEPWDDIPFDMNIESFIQIFTEIPNGVSVVIKDDLDTLASSLFDRSYFAKKGDWLEDFGLDEFNARLKVKLAEFGFQVHMAFAPAFHDGPDKPQTGFQCDFKDLKMIKDPEMHDVMAV